jgi:WD40 repeat protein
MRTCIALAALPALTRIGARFRSASLPQGHTGRVTCGAFTDGGARLASGAADGAARLWRTADGACERILGLHAKYITCMARSA